MKLEFTPYSASLIPACRAFNERLRRHCNPPFLLPQDAPGTRLVPPGGIAWTQYLAVDGSGAVRGGVLLMDQRGWFQQRAVSLSNIQSPLSEGIADRAYSGVGLQMLKFVTERNPYAYAVGMGSEQNPFARLLLAAGWHVAPVPFQFSVIRAARFLREVAPLRRPRVGWLARLAAGSGIGAAAVAGWRLAHRRSPLRGYSIEPANGWPKELDTVWERCRADLSFSILRDAQTVADLHPESQSRLRPFLLRSGGQIAGWSASRVTAMRDSPIFGNLVVATILDALAPPEHLSALLTLTHAALCGLGADLIVTNQKHERWQQQFRRLGFLSGPSNYLLALSKPLASALRTEPDAFGRVYVSRADGDGRIHL
ncbi:MAG TPA: hypothetical protein VKR61_08955 [Bryobacteraceae bacterium]|nr:hypothetical protein [Bryobacteraceae bacterium]